MTLGYLSWQARLGLAVSGWLALLCADLIPDDAPLRVAVVLLFVVLCPGTAALGPLRPTRDGAAQSLLLVVLLSFSALVVASTALMLGGVFTGLRTLAVLAVLTTVAALLPARR